VGRLIPPPYSQSHTAGIEVMILKAVGPRGPGLDRPCATRMGVLPKGPLRLNHVFATAFIDFFPMSSRVFHQVRFTQLRWRPERFRDVRLERDPKIEANMLT
jgi:hypothetical protein